MQNMYHHKRVNSDIPNIKLNPRNTIVNASLISEAKTQNSREINQYSTYNSNSLSKRKEISSTPNQNLTKLSGTKQMKKIQHVPNIKPKIGSELMHASGMSGTKFNGKLTGISPFHKKIGTPMKTNQTPVQSRNTSYNRIEPKEAKIPCLKKLYNIPMMKNYNPPKSYRKANTNRDDVLNLTNLSKNSKLNDTSNSVLSTDRMKRNAESNSKSASRNSKTSSKSRSGTPKFKNNINKLHMKNNIHFEVKNISNNINVINKMRNLNQTHSNLKSVSKSKSPNPQTKIPNLANKIKNIQNIIPKNIPKMNYFIPKVTGYTAIHAMNKSKTNMSTNYNKNSRMISNANEMNYTNLYHSLLNNSNLNSNLNDISTTSSKLDQYKDKKITNNPSNNSIISNMTNVTKEKDKNEFSYNIPYKYSDKDTAYTMSRKENIADGFKSDLKFKEITTSPLIRGKNEQNISRLVLDSDAGKKEGKNLYELFKKTQDSSSSLVHNKNPIPMNIESYLKRIKTAPKETKKNIKMIHEFSHIGYSDDGTKKMNQDVYFKYKNLGGNSNQIYFGVCDGHGLRGHDVSGYLKENLPAFLNHQIKVYSQESIEAIIEETFLEINFNLHTSDSIDTLYSGSTCVSLVYTPEKLTCANVGDSRAVLGKLRDGKWINYDLTRDHKPSEEDEAQRIYEKGGRIEPFKDDETGEFIGPPRVWLKENHVPGLAMSRSFGDRVASSVGVIAEPEITEYNFVDEDKFIIIASDGVWEFIESDECVNIIKDFYIKKDPVACCEFLYKQACKRWMEEEECIDDITMILIFLED